MVAAPMCLFAEVKIGTVDTQEVFTLMPELKTAQASLEEVNKKYQTEYKALQEEFNKKLQEYQALAKDTPMTSAWQIVQISFGKPFVFVSFLS